MDLTFYCIKRLVVRQFIYIALYCHYLSKFVSGIGCLQVRTVSAQYIMKCDDDTFVRVDAVLDEAKKVPRGRSLYIGNINYYHKPLRHGKWAVTYEVCVVSCDPRAFLQILLHNTMFV